MECRRPRNPWTPHAFPRLATSACTGLYVDIENLPGTLNARRILDAALEQWPEDHPPVRALRVYARADKTALWQAWCADRVPDVRVRGVQRFRRESPRIPRISRSWPTPPPTSPWSAVQFVAVLSDDSDSASLYVKIAEFAAAAGYPHTLSSGSSRRTGVPSRPKSRTISRTVCVGRFQLSATVAPWPGTKRRRRARTLPQSSWRRFQGQGALSRQRRSTGRLEALAEPSGGRQPLCLRHVPRQRRLPRLGEARRDHRLQECPGPTGFHPSTDAANRTSRFGDGRRGDVETTVRRDGAAGTPVRPAWQLAACCLPPRPCVVDPVEHSPRRRASRHPLRGRRRPNGRGAP